MSSLFPPSHLTQLRHLSFSNSIVYDSQVKPLIMSLDDEDDEGKKKQKDDGFSTQFLVKQVILVNDSCSLWTSS